jgi:hypothetical protein
MLTSAELDDLRQEMAISSAWMRGELRHRRESGCAVEAAAINGAALDQAGADCSVANAAEQTVSTVCD